MKLVAFSLAILALAALASANFEYDMTMRHEDLFAQYLNNYNIQFSSEEERNERFAVFASNVEKVKALNKDAMINGQSTRYALNEFALMSEDEFVNTYLNKQMPNEWVRTENSRVAPLAAQAELDELPEHFDWRDTSPPVVTPVKNQGRCGSCWAFSTTGNIEGLRALAGYGLEGLSEQNLVDCDHTCNIYGVCNGGCNGGLMELSFTGIIKAGGIMNEKDYPYEGKDLKCRFDKSKVAATISNYTFVAKNPQQIQAYLFKNGPMAIAADASSWQFYYGGIFNSYCGTRINHAILLVGWGVDTEKNIPYWILKNSWGADWGMKGYILVERGGNKCGLEEYPISAIL